MQFLSYDMLGLMFPLKVIKTREKSGRRCLGEVLVYERFQL